MIKMIRPRASRSPSPEARLTLGILLLVAGLGFLSERSSAFTVHEQEYLRRHVMLIDGRGRPLDPASKELFDGGIVGGPEFEAHLDTLLAGLRRDSGNGPGRILLFVHGGLNTYAGARQRALRLGPAMESAGYEPLFLIWSSNLAVGLKDQLLRARNDLEVNALENYIYLAMDWGTTPLRGVARFPQVYYQQVKEDLSTISPTFLPAQVDMRRVYAQLRRRYDANPANEIEISWAIDDGLNWWHKIGRGLLWARTAPITWASSWIVTELGDGAWHSMRYRSQAVFRRPDEFTYDPADSLSNPDDDGRGQGGLTRYINAFDERLKAAKGKGRHYELTVVGHSMGTIIINEILRHWPELPYSRIIYMAAACYTEEAERSLIPALRNNPDAEFYNLCLHPNAETREMNYGNLPHRGTLLAWIDNFYNTPESFLSRTFGRWNNAVLATSIFPADLRGQVRMKAFGIGFNPPADTATNLVPFKGSYPGPQCHGDFGDYAFWEDAFLAPITGSTESQALPWATAFRGGLQRCFREGDWGWLAELGYGLRWSPGVTLALAGRLELGDSGYSASALPPDQDTDWFSLGLDVNYENKRVSSDTYIGWGRLDWAGDDGNETSEALVFAPATSYVQHLFGSWDLQLGGGYRFVWVDGFRGLTEHGQSGGYWRLGLQIGHHAESWHP